MTGAAGPPATRLVLVTGMSGAGRSSALKALEDLGFEAVDNLPVGLLGPLLRSREPLPGALAVGLDSRTRGLVPAELAARVGALRAEPGRAVTLLFMECEDETLRRRYTESRRRHPMAADRPVTAGIAAERAFVAPLKAAADLALDTTALGPADLRRWVAGRFGPPPGAAGGPPGRGGPLVSLVSFAYRHGLPREADLVFDVRFLSNPHYVDDLRPLTGRDAAVRDHVMADPEAAPFLARLEALLLPLLPRYAAEGKTYLTIAVGCTGGQHRSVAVVEHLDGLLRAQGWATTATHRDMPRSATAAAAPAGPALAPA